MSTEQNGNDLSDSNAHRAILSLSDRSRARFWKYVSQAPHEKGCWMWIGETRKGAGSFHYGRFHVGDAKLSAHRVSYFLEHGTIDANLRICHECDNPLCVNPAHLFMGTDKDNAQDMTRKGRNNSTRKTHCPSGHPYNDKNTWVHQNGHRVCLICKSTRNAKYRQQNPRRRLKKGDTVIHAAHGTGTFVDYKGCQKGCMNVRFCATASIVRNIPVTEIRPQEEGITK